MTDEAHGYNSEDAPARPASTRWSEDTVQDDAGQDAGLAPPYVPGRRTPPAASTSTTSTSSTPTPASTTSDDDFPFDQFDIDGDAETEGPAGAVGEDAPATDEPDVVEASGSEADEMIWSPEDLDDGDEAFGPADWSYGGAPSTEESSSEPSSTDASSTEPSYAEPSYAEPSHGEDPYGEWTPAYDSDDDPSAVDADLEPIADEAPVEEAGGAEIESAEAETEHRFEPDGSIETGPGERAEEVAAVLDRLAGLLRQDGEEAVRREMQSTDRLTALVSSLLSGHLSARQ